MANKINQLAVAVEKLHGCSAIFQESVQVKEEFQGQTAWEGVVHIFDLTGHSEAGRCYAWSSPVEGSNKRKFFAVLHIPPIDSPEKAVRASIVQEYRSEK